MRDPSIIHRPASHDDDGFLRPQAWDEAKAAFGSSGDIAEMLTRLEACPLASPRLLLAAAIHSFVSADESHQAAVLRNYLSRSVNEPPPGLIAKGTNGHVRHSAVPRNGVAKRTIR
jgi:hypothetical protein